jgi:hypothetical protein
MNWFLYIGIFLFFSHLLLHGISMDLPFFGIFLIIIGWWKIALWNWVYVVTWIFIIIDILATIYRMQQVVGNYLDPSGELNKDYDEDDENELDNDEEKKPKAKSKNKKREPMNKGDKKESMKDKKESMKEKKESMKDKKESDKKEPMKKET